MLYISLHIIHIANKSVGLGCLSVQCGGRGCWGVVPSSLHYCFGYPNLNLGTHHSTQLAENKEKKGEEKC